MVDEQIAKAWKRLTGSRVRLHHDGRWVYHDLAGTQDEAVLIVPDPATKPWEWVKALWKSGHSMAFCVDFVNVYGPHGGEWRGEADTPEAALEAAIRAWAAPVVGGQG